MASRLAKDDDTRRRCRAYIVELWLKKFAFRSWLAVMVFDLVTRPTSGSGLVDGRFFMASLLSLAGTIVVCVILGSIAWWAGYAVDLKGKPWSSSQ